MKTLVWGHYCRVQVPRRGKSERAAGRRRLEWGLLDQVGFGQKGGGEQSREDLSLHTLICKSLNCCGVVFSGSNYLMLL